MTGCSVGLGQTEQALGSPVAMPRALFVGHLAVYLLLFINVKKKVIRLIVVVIRLGQ